MHLPSLRSLFSKTEDEEVKGRPPILLRLRSSTGYITLVVGFSVCTDLVAYSSAVPVLPYELQRLGYSNVDQRTGFLVAAFSAGIVLSTPPIAWAGSHYRSRRGPLLVTLLFMAASLVMFLVAPSYPVMVLARIFQGISGTGVWTLGMSLLNDSVPEERVGTVIGRAMIGLSIGQSIGSPVGGVLYQKLGFHAPFIFAIILVAVDFALRLLVIEKHIALKWIEAGVTIEGFEAPGYDKKTAVVLPPAIPLAATGPIEAEAIAKTDSRSPSNEADDEIDQKETKPVKKPTLPGLRLLFTHPRPLTLFAVSFLNGFVFGCIDSALVLWLALFYGMTSLRAGLVFFALIIPSFIASPLAGIATDRWGAKWICFAGVVLSVPAYACLIIRGPLPLFIFFLCLIGFSLSAFLPPVMQDLSALSSENECLDASHAFSLFNLATSLGSLVGPIIVAEVLDDVGTSRGWTIVCAVNCAMSGAVLAPIAIWVGGKVRKKDGGDKEATVIDEAARVVD